MTYDGFPHSEISGSKRVCRSPKLIAACCVLHRQIMPRHPLIAVTGFMQTLTILGVYFTYLQNFRFSKNKIVPSTDPPRVVGPDGLEPSTPRLSSACSNQLSYTPRRPAVAISNLKFQISNPKTGGAEEIRTPDL